MAACSSVDCSINSRVMCHYSIQDANGNNAQLAYPLTVTLNRAATDDDTVFINMLNNVSTFDLPLSHVADTDQITLSLAIKYTVIVDTIETEETEYITDKIRLAKTNTPVFESVDCTPRYNHEIKGIEFTRNFIDTIIINKEKVTKDASAPNILIRLRSSSN